MYRVAILFALSCSSLPVTVHQFSDSPGLWFDDVNLFDGEDAVGIRDVWVDGPRIAGVFPSDTDPAPGAQVIAGAGKTLLPGLIDSHAHLESGGFAPWQPRLASERQNALAYLYAGVTAVLVASHHGHKEIDLAEEAQSGRSALPHLFLAGPGLSPPDGHPMPIISAMMPWPVPWFVSQMHPSAATTQEARARVRELAAMAAFPFFKIYFDAIPPGTPHLTEPVLRAAVQAARAHGMRPVAHTGSAEDTVSAVRAGVELLMHTPSTGKLSAAELSYLQRARVPFVSTVRLATAPIALDLGLASDLDREMVAADVLLAFQNRPSDWSLRGFPEFEPYVRTYDAAIRENFRSLLAAEVEFFVGTDSGMPGVFAGAGLHNEMDMLIELGASPLQVLRAATGRPGRFLDPGGRRGLVRAGYLADLLLVRGDPLRDFSAVHHIDTVVLGGRRLERQRLVK